jgi:hypothetical protein
MAQEPEYPDRGYNTDDVAAMRAELPRKGFARRHWLMLTLVILIFGPAIVFTIWSGVSLRFSYSSGYRTGYVQKISKKGWLCKTWEGELTMSNVPGSAPEKFLFTVRDDSLAQAISGLSGRLVALNYQQHVGVPTSCFGDTQYFVVGVRQVK